MLCNFIGKNLPILEHYQKWGNNFMRKYSPQMFIDLKRPIQFISVKGESRFVGLPQREFFNIDNNLSPCKQK